MNKGEENKETTPLLSEKRDLYSWRSSKYLVIIVVFIAMMIELIMLTTLGKKITKKMKKRTKKLEMKVKTVLSNVVNNIKIIMAVCEPFAEPNWFFLHMCHINFIYFII